MLLVMAWLLDTYEPDPDNFRFGNPTSVALFAVVTIGAPAIGLAARHRWSTLTIAAAQATSPLWLIDAAVNDDLNFALLLWAVPLPAFAGWIVALDCALSWWWRRG